MSEKPDELGKELLALKNQNGVINAVTAVDWARTNQKSRLYAALEWDDAVGAEKYRVWQVRTLIAVHVVDADGSRAAISLSIDRNGSGGYRPISEVMEQSNLREIMLQDALAELERVQNKYSRLEELQRVWLAANEVREARVPRRKRAA